MDRFLIVGLGGGLGAMARYGISLLPWKGVFPVLTLVTNLLGAVLIGFVVGIYNSKGISENKLLFLKTGVCGGFTTFSTFSLEAWTLLERGEGALGVLYVIASVAFCLVGIWCGHLLAKCL